MARACFGRDPDAFYTSYAGVVRAQQDDQVSHSNIDAHLQQQGRRLTAVVRQVIEEIRQRLLCRMLTLHALAVAVAHQAVSGDRATQSNPLSALHWRKRLSQIWSPTINWLRVR